METLPKMCDYSEPMGVLPAGTENYAVSCYPVNGSVFAPGQQIQIDLNNQGFLDPDSLIIRYKITLTVPISATASTFSISGLPYLAPFIRCETLLNSAVSESVNNYNSLTTALANMQYSLADKQGMASALGYITGTIAGGASPASLGPIGTDYSLTPENPDGLTLQLSSALTGASSTISFYFSGPLPCLLSNCEKLFPLSGVQTRVQLTLDALANICPNVATDIGGVNPVAGAFSNLSISNVELCYNQISFSPQVERQMFSNPKIRIKTSSYATGIQNIPTATNGGVSLIYNMRYASVKSMFAIFGSSSNTNKLFDSSDLTSNNGSYQFLIGGLVFPQAQLSSLNNKGGILMELRNAMRDIYTGNNSMSISNKEWSGIDGTTTAPNVPSKFYVGTSLRKVNQWGNETSPLFSGVSTQSSPIGLNIQTATVTTKPYSPILVLWYDSIVELDTVSKQVNYIY